MGQRAAEEGLAEGECGLRHVACVRAWDAARAGGGEAEERKRRGGGEEETARWEEGAGLVGD